MPIPFFNPFKMTKEEKEVVSLYEKYHARMERTAMSILHISADAEDAVQNAFIRVIKNPQKIFEIPCEKIPAWLITIVKNEARMILRKRKHGGDEEKAEFVSLEELSPVEEPACPEPDAEGEAEYRSLVRLIRSMPETYRTVLELKLISGYKDAEIAKLLGISETAVSSRASRGRAKLREILEEEGICP